MRLRVAALCAAFVFLGCASTPPSKERPIVGCWFDELRRFTYALIIERDSFTTRWVPRQLMTSSRNTLDTEERVSPTSSIRPGHCPDEVASLTGQHRNVWKQGDDR